MQLCDSIPYMYVGKADFQRDKFEKIKKQTYINIFKFFLPKSNITIKILDLKVY